MTSSKITAMATLALSLVLIGSVITGRLFVVNALLPDTANIKITSPPKGQAVPVGNLTISGTSSDNATTDCQVYAGWNDLKPYHTVVANGARGVNDYSKWAFTYTNTYHAITNGTNKLTAKLSCDDNSGSLAKWHSVNVTGVLPVVVPSSSQSTTNITKLLAAIQGQQNSTDKLQEAIFRSLQVQVPAISETTKSSITQLQQQQQGITPQELQNALKISLDDLSPKQKSMLTQPQVDLLETTSPLIQKGPIALISKDTQAFKLFSEGKKPIEVAIRLDLKADEVDRLYQQFWKLEGLYQLNLIHKEIRRYLPSFLNLFKIMKQQKTMSEQNMAETDKKLSQLENIKNNNKDYQRLKGYLNKRLTIF